MSAHRDHSSMAEQGTHNPLVGGSNPSGPTKEMLKPHPGAFSLRTTSHEIRTRNGQMPSGHFLYRFARDTQAQARVRNVNFKVFLANEFLRRYYGQTDFGNRAFSSAGEHYLHTVGVTGSNPVTPTTNYKPGKPGFFHARS